MDLQRTEDAPYSGGVMLKVGIGRDWAVIDSAHAVEAGSKGVHVLSP